MLTILRNFNLSSAHACRVEIVLILSLGPEKGARNTNFSTSVIMVMLACIEHESLAIYVVCISNNINATLPDNINAVVWMCEITRARFLFTWSSWFGTEIVIWWENRWGSVFWIEFMLGYIVADKTRGLPQIELLVLNWVVRLIITA